MRIIHHIILIFLSIPGFFCQAQQADYNYRTENRSWREGRNMEFRDSVQTPLTHGGWLLFKKLDVFPVRSRYVFRARLVRTPGELPFEIPRTKGNTGTYRKYGELRFSFRGKEYVLSVYQQMKLIADANYAKHLFLPFTDLTNGKKTYITGRYLDLMIPEGDELILDFNKAYNPYCAYGNPKYSCPIPPAENHLDIEIKAGEKQYHEP